MTDPYEGASAALAEDRALFQTLEDGAMLQEVVRKIDQSLARGSGVAHPRYKDGYFDALLEIRHFIRVTLELRA